jgi:hypothetical protein
MSHQYHEPVDNFFSSSPVGAIVDNARASPAENHPRKNALVRRSQSKHKHLSAKAAPMIFELQRKPVPGAAEALETILDEVQRRGTLRRVEVRSGIFKATEFSRRGLLVALLIATHGNGVPS